MRFSTCSKEKTTNRFTTIKSKRLDAAIFGTDAAVVDNVFVSDAASRTLDTSGGSIIRAYAEAFFDKYLKGESALLPDDTATALPCAVREIVTVLVKRSTSQLPG